MPIRALQYGLIMIPALLYMLKLPLHDEGAYTLNILIVLGMAVWRDFTGMRTWRPLLLFAEMLWTCVLIAIYGPWMILISLSVLYVYMYILEKNQRWLMLGLQLLATNAALYFHYAPGALSPWLHAVHTGTSDAFLDEAAGRIICNLMLLITATLSWQGSKTASSREQLEQVYDALRKKHYELQNARAQLLAFAKQLEDAAQAEERTRISRQLHDDIGHRLIRAKMMSEAAIVTLPAKPELGLEMVKQIRDQLSATMDDMRSTLHKLRPATHLTEAYALDRLLEDVGRETGVKTGYRVSGEVVPLYPSLQIVLYKNAKEALTNALRHGKAGSIDIELHYSAHEICMVVTNDGEAGIGPQSGNPQRDDSPFEKAPPSPSALNGKTTPASTGLGVEGMRVRTELVGGELEIQPAYPYTVITRLPIARKADMI